MKIKSKEKSNTKVKKQEAMILTNEHFVKKEFFSKRLDFFSSDNCSFVDCDFKDLVVSNACFGAGFGQSLYERCLFKKVRFKSPAPGNVKFTDCEFHEVDIREFIGVSAEFIRCRFIGKIKKAVFNRIIPSEIQRQFGRAENEFIDNDFREVVFDDVGFRSGIDLSKQLLPSDGEYILVLNAEDVVNKVRERFFVEKNIELRQNAFNVLRILEYDLNAGQRQLYIRRKDFPKSLGEALDIIFSMLESG